MNAVGDIIYVVFVNKKRKKSANKTLVERRCSNGGLLSVIFLVNSLT